MRYWSTNTCRARCDRAVCSPHQPESAGRLLSATRPIGSGAQAHKAIMISLDEHTTPAPGRKPVEHSQPSYHEQQPALPMSLAFILSAGPKLGVTSCAEPSAGRGTRFLLAGATESRALSARNLTWAEGHIPRIQTRASQRGRCATEASKRPLDSLLSTAFLSRAWPDATAGNHGRGPQPVPARIPAAY